METFKINYKSDFVLRLASDAGWGTAFTLEFWAKGAATKRYYATHDGNGNYTNCKPDSDTELRVMFDDHGLGIGNLMLRITYSLADEEFRTGKDDEVVNVAAITVLNDEGEEVNVMLNLEGETAAEVQYSLPLLEAEKQRQNAEAQRIADEQQRQTAEAARVTEFETNEAERQATFKENEARREADTADTIAAAESATSKANSAADRTNKAITDASAATSLANQATAKANTATANAEAATGNANTATAESKAATEKALSATEGALTVTEETIKAAEDAKKATADTLQAFGVLVPISLQVEYPKALSLGNAVSNYIVPKLAPESALPNVIYISDNKSLTVEPNGKITPVKVGVSRIHVIPTLNTSLARTISIGIYTGLRKVLSASLRLTSNGNLRLI